MSRPWMTYAINIAMVLALVVVMLGAYTRLTHAGLGCPDWPKCYGNWIVTEGANPLLEVKKAWTEMLHRYFAGTLGFLIFGIGFCLVWQRAAETILALLLMALVLAQATLGMWTVTWKLLPAVVIAHLLGGILIFSLLCCLRLQMGSRAVVVEKKLVFLVGLGVLISLGQIVLGGLVSANYAGLACGVDFPKCNGSWRILTGESLSTLQMLHRLGALVTFLYTVAVAIGLSQQCRSREGGNPSLIRHCALFMDRFPPARERQIIGITGALLLVVILQVALGISNVVYGLPLWLAVAHNGVAAIFFSLWLCLFCLLKPKEAR